MNLKCVLLFFLLPLSTILLSSLLFLEEASLPFSFWSAARLSIGESVYHGYKLYYPKDHGPILGMIYGPVSALIWLFFALIEPITLKIVFAGLVQFFISILPFIIISFWSIKKDRNLFHSFLSLIFAWILLFSFSGTKYICTQIHVDGIAVSLALISSLILSAGNGQRNVIISSLFLSLAIWTKQSAVFIFPAHFAFLFLCSERRKQLLTYCVSSVVFNSIALVLTSYFLSYSFSSMAFNLITIPASHPFVSRGEIVTKIKEFSFQLILLFILIFSLVPRSFFRFKVLIENKRAFLLFLVAIFALPMSILGAIKVGGDVNSYHSLYYLVALAELLYLKSLEKEGSKKAFSLFVFCFAILCFRTFDNREYQKINLINKLNPQEFVDLKIKDVNSRFYFAWNPLQNLSRYHQLNHFAYGVYDRFLAGFPPTREHLLENFPKNSEFIVFPQRGEVIEILKVLGPEVQRVGVRGFDSSWSIYKFK